MQADHFIFANTEQEYSLSQSRGVRSNLSQDHFSPKRSFDQIKVSNFDDANNASSRGSLNTSADDSTGASSPSELRDSGAAKDGKNFVMIDQVELLELMQAKKILDAQKISQNIDQAVQNCANAKQTTLKHGFNSALFFQSSEDCENDNIESKFLPSDLFNCDEDEISPKLGSEPQRSISDPLDLSQFRLEKNFSQGNNKYSRQVQEAPMVSAFDPMAGPESSMLGGSLMDAIDQDSSSPVTFNSLHPRAQNSANIDQKVSSIFSSDNFFEKDTDSAQAKFQQVSSAYQMFGQQQPQYFAASIPQVQTGCCDASEKKFDKKRGDFEFPEGGWECSKCQNYNFKGRKECHRCKKPKSNKDTIGKPEHMFKAQDEKDAMKASKSKQKKQAKNKKKGAQTTTEQTPSSDESCNSSSEKTFEKTKKSDKSKQQSERAGDWICQRCNNHNFSFRQVCNKCQLSHSDSDQMLSIKKQQEARYIYATQQYVQPQQPFQQPYQANGVVYNQNCTFNTFQVQHMQQPQQACFPAQQPLLPNYMPQYQVNPQAMQWQQWN